MTTITIICPTLNEERYIAGTITSFLAQRRELFELEILIVDGMSTDRTREIVNAFSEKNPIVRLIDNEKRKTPFAFNKGLQEAHGEFVAILGAHTEYAPDYLHYCYSELLYHHAVGCTGRIISRAPTSTMQAMIVEWIMDNPFGVSGSSFRTMKEGYTHSVNFAVFEKKPLLALGGYDTTMFRNQDNDMNQRLLDAGHKLYCTWKTSCQYYTPSTVSKLFQYARNNGYWNAISLRTKARSMRLYHFIPFLFLLGLIGLLAGAIAESIFFGSAYSTALLSVALGSYFLSAIAFTLVSYFKKPDIRKMLLPFYFFWFHISYGWGTLTGLAGSAGN